MSVDNRHVINFTFLIHLDAFLRKAVNKSITRPYHACMYSDQRECSVFVNRTKQVYIFKRHMNDDSDGAHLTSFGIEFQIDEANENERTPSVALVRTG